MIRIDVDEPALVRTRLAVSPLWETVASLVLLARHGDHAPWPYTTWARVARRTLRETVPGLPLHRFAEPGAFLPPVPPAPSPSIGEELARLRGQPSGFADAIEAYWRVVMARRWPAMRAVLEEEILLRGRTLATEGPDALLAGLRYAQWKRPQLTVTSRAELSWRLRDGQLTLVPLLFAHDTCLFGADVHRGAAVSYQARGAALLATARTDPYAAPQRGDRLAILVGSSRAQVVRALARPATTSVLARALGLAASTVSEHLTALVAAGVVRRQRVGGRVLYQLDPCGTALLRSLDVDPHSADTECLVHQASGA